MLFKKIVLSLVVVFMVMISVGCGDSNSSDKLNVITTVFPYYDFVREIGEDKVDLEMLLDPGTDFHSYEPTPKDIIMIEEADLFIYNGGEEWIDEILKGIDTSNVEIIRLMDYTDLSEEEFVAGMEHNHEEEHADEHDHEEEHADEHDHEDDKLESLVGYDEHVWTSLRNSIDLVNAISDKLVLLDEANKIFYEENTNNYVKELEKLDEKFVDMINNSARQEIVVGDKFPFMYFAHDYDLTYSAAFSGCSTASEASSQTIAFLIDKVNDNSIPVVFEIELSNGAIASTIADETNTETLMLHSAHNLTKEDFDAGKTYLDYMNDNYNNLKKALN